MVTVRATSSTGKASSSQNRRRPSSAWAASLAIVVFTWPSRSGGASSGHQVGEDALERLVAGGEVVEREAGRPGPPRQADGEAAEVVDLDVEAAVGSQAYGAHGRLGDEQGGEGPVVAGHDGVLHGPVGHQPADRAEVAGGGVPAGDHHLDVPG